jgi:heme exporter protein B
MVKPKGAMVEPGAAMAEASVGQLSLLQCFCRQLRRELLLAYRRRSDIANPLLFFVIVASLFPLGVSPAPQTLKMIASGVIWVVALLACLFACDGLFRTDYEDGSLEQLLLSPQPTFVLVLAKVVAHWCVSGLPLTLMSPLLGLMLYLPPAAFSSLLWSLGLGSLTLSFLGAIGAALTVSLRRSGVLMSLIILPLYTPVLIFGASAVQSAVDGFAEGGQLLVLGAMLALSVTLSPFAIVAALRIGVDD